MGEGRGDAGHQEPADAAAAPAAAAPAAAAARGSRAGYINTRFHTPELTSANPAQPHAGPAQLRAGGGREHRAGGRQRPGRLEEGGWGASQRQPIACVAPNVGRRRHPSPEPMAAQQWTGRPAPTPPPRLSYWLPPPPSPPSPSRPSQPSSASRVLPSWVRSCSWRNRGTRSQPMGSGETRRLALWMGRSVGRRAAEPAVNQSNVGPARERAGRARAGGTGKRVSAEAGGPSLQKPCHLFTFPWNENPEI